MAGDVIQVCSLAYDVHLTAQRSTHATGRARSHMRAQNRMACLQQRQPLNQHCIPDAASQAATSSLKRLTFVPNDAAPREPQGTRVHGLHLYLGVPPRSQLQLRPRLQGLVPLGLLLHQGLGHPLPLQGLLQPRPRRDAVHRISAAKAVPVFLERGRPGAGWQPLRHAERRFHGEIENTHCHTPPNTSK